jgi:hypothetical protein
LLALLIMSGLAGMTRYIGFMLIPVVLLSILLLDKSNYRDKLLKIVSIIIMCSIPIAIWIIRNMIISGTLVNRNISYHPIQLGHLERAARTLSSWFFIPISISFVSKVLILMAMASVAIAIMIIMLKKLGMLSDLNRVPLICIFFLCVYAGALIFSILFVEPNLPLSDHYLLPFYIVLGTGLVTLGRNAIYLTERSKWAAVLVVSLGAAFLVAQGEQSTRMIKPLSENGVGFNGRAWKFSKTIDFIKTLPDDTPIYSNAPDAIGFLTGRQTKMIPSRQNPAGSDGQGDSGKAMKDMIRQLEDAKGFLIYFKMISWRGYVLNAEELKQYAELQSIYEGWDGSVYRVRLLQE